MKLFGHIEFKLNIYVHVGKSVNLIGLLRGRLGMLCLPKFDLATKCIS